MFARWGWGTWGTRYPAPGRQISFSSGSLAYVPRRAYGKDTIIAADEQHPLQKPATLIVQEIFVPFVFHELGYHNDDRASGILRRKVENVLNDGDDYEAIG